MRALVDHDSDDGSEDDDGKEDDNGDRDDNDNGDDDNDKNYDNDNHDDDDNDNDSGNDDDDNGDDSDNDNSSSMITMMVMMTMVMRRMAIVIAAAAEVATIVDDGAAIEAPPTANIATNFCEQASHETFRSLTARMKVLTILRRRSGGQSSDRGRIFFLVKNGAEEFIHRNKYILLYLFRWKSFFFHPWATTRTRSRRCCGGV